MNLTHFLTSLTSMLALLTTLLEAKPTEHRHRHMRDLPSNNQSENTQEPVFPLPISIRHDASRRRDQPERKRRDYSRWVVDQDDTIKYRIRRPSAYAYNRSYFLPVYGNDQFRKYRPAQPYNSPNNIFPDFEDVDDPRPKWGHLQTESTTLPTRRPRKTKKYILRGISTRKPKQRTTTEIPPFVQQVNNGKIQLSAIDDAVDQLENIPVGSSTVKPQKELRLQHLDSPNNHQEIKTTMASSTISSTTEMTSPSGPSNCAWAVVFCCSTTSTQVAESCFEAKGCPGPFWDRSPCESEFAKAAIKRALEYYH